MKIVDPVKWEPALAFQCKKERNGFGDGRLVKMQGGIRDVYVAHPALKVAIENRMDVC